MDRKLIECIPNFSEGRDLGKIKHIAWTIESVEGIRLLHVHSNHSANRTVISFAGNPEQVVRAAYAAIKKASVLIDMRHHAGTHPRIGATDVCPFVPLKNISMEETAEYARALAELTGKDLNIPVYCYEYAASKEQRRRLESIRKGEYEGLQQKLLLPEWKPDFGPALFNARTGATAIGARNTLVAFNINLDARSKEDADAIARTIRESGTQNTPGMFKQLKAIGWYVEEYCLAQVSCNFTDIHTTPLHVVYEAVKKLAAKRNIMVTGSELIGLIPLKALTDAGKYYLGVSDAEDAPEESLIQAAIEGLGLNDVDMFRTGNRIIEYRLFGKTSK